MTIGTDDGQQFESEWAHVVSQFPALQSYSQQLAAKNLGTAKDTLASYQKQGQQEELAIDTESQGRRALAISDSVPRPQPEALPEIKVAADESSIPPNASSTEGKAPAEEYKPLKDRMVEAIKARDEHMAEFSKTPHGMLLDALGTALQGLPAARAVLPGAGKYPSPILPTTSEVREALWRPPETIQSAALRTKSGDIYTGQMHADAWDKMETALGDKSPTTGVEEGFTTSTGRFVSRELAARLHKYSGGKAGNLLRAEELPENIKRESERADRMWEDLGNQPFMSKGH